MKDISNYLKALKATLSMKEPSLCTKVNTHIPPRACKCASNVFNPKTPTSALSSFRILYIFCLPVHLQPSCFTDNAEAINFEISDDLLRLGLQEDSVYMCVYTDFHSTLVIIEIIMKNHQKTLSDAGKL